MSPVIAAVVADEQAKREEERRRIDMQLAQLLKLQESQRTDTRTPVNMPQGLTVPSTITYTQPSNLQQIPNSSSLPVNLQNNATQPGNVQQRPPVDLPRVAVAPDASPRNPAQSQGVNVIPSLSQQNMTQINSQLDKIMMDMNKGDKALSTNTPAQPQTTPQKTDIIQDAVNSLKIDPAIQSQADLDTQIQALMQLLTPPPQLQNTNCNCEPKVETVCGKDGVTYVNGCVAACLQAEIARKGGC